jgi:hypothetical protein
MPDGEGSSGGVLPLAGDIVAAAAALAGFILVYLSALAPATPILTGWHVLPFAVHSGVARGSLLSEFDSSGLCDSVARKVAGQHFYRR